MFEKTKLLIFIEVFSHMQCNLQHAIILPINMAFTRIYLPRLQKLGDCINTILLHYTNYFYED